MCVYDLAVFFRQLIILLSLFSPFLHILAPWLVWSQVGLRLHGLLSVILYFHFVVADSWTC